MSNVKLQMSSLYNNFNFVINIISFFIVIVSFSVFRTKTVKNFMLFVFICLLAYMIKEKRNMPKVIDDKIAIVGALLLDCMLVIDFYNNFIHIYPNFFKVYFGFVPRVLLVDLGSIFVGIVSFYFLYYLVFLFMPILYRVIYLTKQFFSVRFLIE